jgi:predicted nucleic acid-binding protein
MTTTMPPANDPSTYIRRKSGSGTTRRSDHAVLLKQNLWYTLLIMVSLVYMDNCCFNRPFDDKSVFRNRLEADAKLYVQKKILEGSIGLVWSFILELENSENPYDEIRTQVASWKDIATNHVRWSQSTVIFGERLQKEFVIKSKDALHLACALSANASCFLTTDKKFLAKIRTLKDMVCINPVEWIEREDQ